MNEKKNDEKLRQAAREIGEAMEPVRLEADRIDGPITARALRVMAETSAKEAKKAKAEDKGTGGH